MTTATHLNSEPKLWHISRTYNIKYLNCYAQEGTVTAPQRMVLNTPTTVGFFSPWCNTDAEDRSTAPHAMHKSTSTFNSQPPCCCLWVSTCEFCRIQWSLSCNHDPLRTRAAEPWELAIAVADCSSYQQQWQFLHKWSKLWTCDYQSPAGFSEGKIKPSSYMPYWGLFWHLNL